MNKLNNKLFDLFKKYDKNNVLEMIDRLEDKHKNIMYMYFGINEERKAVKEIASIYNVKEISIYKTIDIKLF